MLNKKLSGYIYNMKKYVFNALIAIIDSIKSSALITILRFITTLENYLFIIDIVIINE